MNILRNGTGGNRTCNLSALKSCCNGGRGFLEGGLSSYVYKFQKIGLGLVISANFPI